MEIFLYGVSAPAGLILLVIIIIIMASIPAVAGALL